MTKFTRKILFTVTSCLVCLGIAVGTLLAVLAQSNILVTTDVSVSYVSEINATVASHYWLQGQQGGKTQLLATTEIAEGTKTNAEPVDVRLSQTQRYVVFEYAFTNSMVNLDAWAHLAYTDTDGDDKNMALAWAWSASSVEIGDAFEALDLNEPNSMTIPVNNIELKAGSTKYVYIKVYIDDLREDAVFTGSFKWTFSFDEEATSIEHFTPVLNADGETATLTAYSGEAGENIVVPSYYYVDDAAAVSDVSNTSYSAEHVASKKITITGIGAECFSEQRTVKTIVLPETITTIGDNAFKKCSNLININVPEGVTSIGDNAFSECAIEEVKLPNTLTEIGEYAYYNNATLKRIVVPEGVTTIGNGAFYCCTNLEILTLPSTLETLGASVFYECYALKVVVNLSDLELKNTDIFTGLEETEDYYYGMWKCADLVVNQSYGDTIQKVSEGDFDYVIYGPHKILTGYRGTAKIVVVPEGVTRIGNEAFLFDRTFRTITFPSTLQSIGVFAFNECARLSSLTIPQSVTAIDKNAFYGCYSFLEVVNKSNIDLTNVFYSKANIITDENQSKFEVVGDLVIYDSTILVDTLEASTTIEIPNTVTEIWYYAFAGNTTLEHLIVPTSVTSGNFGTFDGCTNLKTIVMPPNATGIFSGCYDINVDVKLVGSATSVGGFGLSDCVKSADYSELEGLTTLMEGSWGEHTKLTTIILPGSVRNIQKGCTIETSQDVTFLIDNETDYLAATNAETQQDLLNYGNMQTYTGVLYYADTVKVLKSVVDNATTQNAELENSANYTRTTETINGEEYYVYTAI